MHCLQQTIAARSSAWLGSSGREQPAGPAADSDAVSFSNAQGDWWVVHTRARNEKAIAESLAKWDIEHFLPLTRTVRTYGRRRVTSEIPLFPGYLFLCGGLHECDFAWKTNRVAQILRVENQKQLCGELAQIQRVVASDLPVDVYPSLRPGRHCRIISGSLYGVEGVVIRRRNVCRVFVAATFVGQSAVVEVDAASVEVLD